MFGCSYCLHHARTSTNVLSFFPFPPLCRSSTSLSFSILPTNVLKFLSKTSNHHNFASYSSFTMIYFEFQSLNAFRGHKTKRKSWIQKPNRARYDNLEVSLCMGDSHHYFDCDISIVLFLQMALIISFFLISENGDYGELYIIISINT